MTEPSSTTLRISVDLALDAADAFEIITEELAAALARMRIRFELGPNGRVLENEVEVGRVTRWVPHEEILLDWRPPDWTNDEQTSVAIRFSALDGGTRITLEHRGWGRLVRQPGEIAAWFAHELAAPMFRSTAPAAFGDWLTDRMARRPSGKVARAVYRDPLYHYPNFGALLEELALAPDDYLLEVGCGGGAFLRQALRSGCRAAAVDHSPDMVRLAREENHDAVAVGRLEIREATADSLPFPDGTFTCASMTGVLGFLPDPVASLVEIRRVLQDGGRIVIFGSDPAWRGTPAAPEPFASRLLFFDDYELARLGSEAGFDSVRVVRRDLEPFAIEAGVPEEVIPLFKGPGAPYLLGRKG